MSRRSVLLVLICVILAAASAVAGCWWQIYTVGRPSVLDSAQAAVVLGASVWPGGRPSPTLESRTATAVRLYQEGTVGCIATTGGVTADYPSEGSVAAAFAMQQGVPEECLIVEGTSTSTWENLSNLLPMLREEGIDDIVIVSDAFHLARARRMALDLGVGKVQACASDSPMSRQSISRYELRELMALLGYLYMGPTYHEPLFSVFVVS